MTENTHKHRSSPTDGNGSDKNFTKPLRMSDKLLNALGISKSDKNIKNMASNQSLNAQPPLQSVQPAPVDPSVDNVTLPGEHTVEFNDLKEKPLATSHSEASLPSTCANEHIHLPPCQHQSITGIFSMNLPKPVIKTDLPRPQDRIESTEQLAYCNTLLLLSQSTSTPVVAIDDDKAISGSNGNGPKALNDQGCLASDLDGSERAWLQVLEQDPIEQHHLRCLALKVVEEFVNDNISRSAVIAEVVILGPVLDRSTFRSLLSCFLDRLEKATLLDIGLLQGLVQLVEGATSGHVEDDDLVKTLAVLRRRLTGTHRPSSEHLYQVVLAISRLLDIMINCMVKDLNRTEDHQPLACILTELKDTDDSILRFQVNYALQALQYIPDDESTLQAVLRFAGGVTMATLGVASVCKLDPTNLFNSLDTLRQAAGQLYEVTKTNLEAMEASQKSCSGAMQSLVKGIRAGTRHEWYLTLLAGRMFVRDGRLADFKRTVHEAHCRNERSFQTGVCQILAEIAADPLWDLVTRHHAVDFLGALYNSSGSWKPHPDVKQWILVILTQISGLSGVLVNVVNEHATSVLQVLNHDGIAIDSASYPLTSRPPRPDVFPLLIRAQKIPYVERALHLMMKQRLEEAQLQLYIPPMAKANLQAPDDELFPLMENVQEFLASDRQVMLILGDSGSGKSTFNQRLEYLLCTEYKRGGPIPLFINLAAIDNPQQDMVSKQLQFYNFNDDQILELKLHRQLVLICDGYDESQQMVNLHRTNSLNQPGQWNTKMIISCRTQYLGQSYLDRFRPQSTNRYKLAPQGVFQEAVIAPFSRKQIQDYVEKYVPLEPRTLCTHNYMYMLITIPHLMDLVRNPFLLLLALEALPDITKDTNDLSTIKIVRVQLYDTFVDHWLNVNKRRLRSNALSEEDYDTLEKLEEAGFTAMGVDYSRRLASAMYNYQDGKVIVKYVHLQDKATWRVKFFGPDPEVRLLREASPLTRSGSYYQFLHRSMLEYFFSCTVAGSRSLEPDDELHSQSSFDSFGVRLLDPACPLFTRDLLTESSVIQFLSERVQENPSFKTQLLNVIKSSKSDVSLAMAAANSITILVKAGMVFRRHDFRGIRIPGADLSGGQFDSAQFQEADLTNVNLGMSWLRNADFSNACMEGVRFGELPYLEHADGVLACRYSPQGSMLAVGLRSGDVLIYDTQTWENISPRMKHDGAVTSLAFSPDSQRLVSGGEDNTVRLWDCSCEGPPVVIDGHTDKVMSVVFSPCGKKVASASGDKTVRLWDSMSGDALFVLKGHTSVIDTVRFTPNGRQLVSCSRDDTIRLWDVEIGASGGVSGWGGRFAICLDISPDGYQIVCGHVDGTLQLWDTVSGSAGALMRGHIDMVRRVMFSADGQRIASAGNDCTVRVWDSSAGTLTAMFHGTGPCFDVSFSPNGEHLASADIYRKVRLWDANSSGPSAGQHGHTDAVTTVAYLPTGQTIWSGGQDNSVRQWDALTGAVGSTHVFPAYGKIRSIAFAPDFNHTVTGYSNGAIRLWSLQTGKQVAHLEGHTSNVVILTYSPCGQWIASRGADKTIRLWDLRDTEGGYVLATIDCGIFGECSMTFSPTGLQLAASDIYGTVNIYDLQTGTLSSTATIGEEIATALAYSPNGQELAIGNGEGAILFWDLQSKKHFALDVNNMGISCIVYSPCARWIAIAEYVNTTVHLCRRQSNDTGAWDHVTVVEGSLDPIKSIAWNPVVPLEFVTGSRDRSVRVWRISESNDGSAVTVDFVWGSNIGMLSASGMKLRGITGLDALNRKLLLRRGAVDKPVIFVGEKPDTIFFPREVWGGGGTIFFASSNDRYSSESESESEDEKPVRQIVSVGCLNDSFSSEEEDEKYEVPEDGEPEAEE
ncbi:hypothetical protein BGZ96_008882 [Linnemannia gamsii]|uniref:WD40 repeat-like protein n=1 Tax=Linnemannia gamsii TaxID=64522 RepID=A0ABQ7JYL1_9FUNG|nr:hypothetical protein BGZ96_008882 [Linnemannia gamsii]